MNYIFSKSAYWTICTLFILSGVAALIYQVVWFKQLAYFIGSTTYSQSIVLATYMGGLALGAWYWGKKSDNSKHALLLFAILEITLSIYCFFYVPIFDLIENFFTKTILHFELSSDSSEVLILKFIVSGLTILFPTFLMGGTLPILVKFLSKKVEDVGRNVSILYFINSFGAVIGTILAGFYLLNAFGLKNTTYFAASVEMLVGLISIFLSKKMVSSVGVEKEPSDSKKTIKPNWEITEQEAKIAILIAGLSGFCAMVYEVVWLRLLIPVLSSSTYSFTIILAAFISGITIGSYLTYKYGHKIKNPIKFAGTTQLAIVLSMFLSIPIYERLPYWIWTIVNSPIENPTSYSYYLFIQFLLVFFLLLVPTLFMGMTLPVLTKAIVKNIKSNGREVGKIYAINTLGTVLGSLIAGLILIPYLGIYSTIIIAISINLILAYLVFKRKNILSKNQRNWAFISLGISGIIFFTNVSKDSWAYSIMLSQVPRSINRSIPPDTYSEFIENMKKNDTILFYKEGVGGTIIVGKNQEQIYLSTNGKGDANSVTDLRTQVSLGLTPVILHPNAEDVFVIGFGAGTTIGHVLTHPNVKFAEVAEISEEVIEASVHFNSINEKPLLKKNLNVIKDDGVAALRLSPYKYDIIISQPSNPWSAGVGNLFTKEFFHDCKGKLKPGGYVAQWFSYYEMDDKSLQLIIRTALDEFKYVSLWHIGASDIMLLCSEDEFNFDLSKIEKNYAQVKDKLVKIDIHSFGAFLSQQLISTNKGVKTYAGKGLVNSEDHPFLELWAPEAFYYNSEPSKFVALDERKHIEKSDLLLKEYMFSNKGMSDEDILQTGLFQSMGGCKELAFYLADKNPDIYLLWSQKASQVGDEKSALMYLEMAVKKNKAKPSEIAIQKASIYGNKGDFKNALTEINKAINNDPSIAVLHYQKGTFHMSLNEYDKAVPALEKAIQLDPYLIDAYNNLAIIKGKNKDYFGVIALLDKAVVISDKNSKVYFNRGYAKGFLNNFTGAVADFTKAIELDPNYGQAFVFRGQANISLGKQQEACSDFNKAKLLNAQGVDQLLQQFCK